MGCCGSSSAPRPAPSVSYILDRPLGPGVPGVVYRGVERTTNHVVAIKAIPNVGPERIAIEGEIDMMRRFSKHGNIIDFVDAYETPTSIHLVLEYMWGGELFNILPRCGLHSEQDAAGYLRAMASALCYLHRNCVAHRDMKPNNLMLTSELGGDLKVCDLASAKALPTEDAPMWNPHGTWAYAAPEVLWLKLTSGGYYTLKCDLFPVGVILYFLLVGYHPFDPFGAHTQEEMYDNICRGVWDFNGNHWHGISPQAKCVVTALLEVDPVKRLTAKQLRNHAWTRGSVQHGGQLPDGIGSTLKQSYERTSLKIHGQEPYQVHAARPERHETQWAVRKSISREESSIEASIDNLAGYLEERKDSTETLDAVSTPTLASSNTEACTDNVSTADVKNIGFEASQMSFSKAKTMTKKKKGALASKKKALSEPRKRKNGISGSAPKLEVQERRGGNSSEPSLSTSAPSLMQVGHKAPQSSNPLSMEKCRTEPNGKHKQSPVLAACKAPKKRYNTDRTVAASRNQ